ncbi:MAG TPA: hypothetical protein VFU49_00370 [Ktedonobacteraceae bacterium]|nr:hypothetical protein [Ktedonobacteraceae bacterium]
MLTYEDMTDFFLKAAASLSLVAHPEYLLNARTLEREFVCTCHAGSCEEAEMHSSCTVSFTWGALDTALSVEGPAGVCDFFHEAEQDCLHLRTSAIPPLVLDLSYTLALNGIDISEVTLLSLMQLLKLRASEHSRRTVETRPGIAMVLQENRLLPDMLTLQQRVELPIWHPEGMRGLHDVEPTRRRLTHPHFGAGEDEEGGEVIADDPHPEEWLPQVMIEVCQDILHVLEAFDTTIAFKSSGL